MSETYTIKNLRRTFPGTGWDVYTYWAAVDDENGDVIYSAETRAEVISWAERVADNVNGTIHGMSYEAWQTYDPDYEEVK
jgi:hypothetical protein